MPQQADGRLYARAAPEKVEITETYEVQQEISKNRAPRPVGQPTGKVEITIPYDGHDHFTRHAFEDVKHALDGSPVPGAKRATIGHLLLADHLKTHLNKSMRQHGKVGIIPVEVPVAPGGDIDRLVADRDACVISYAYEPDLPEIIPARFDIDLIDSDTRDLFNVEVLTILGRTHPSLVIEKLRQAAGSRNELRLQMGVAITLPVKEGQPRFLPSIKSVSIDWPTITSLRTTRLDIANNPAAWWKPKSKTESERTVLREPHLREAPVRYNPGKRCLEWGRVPMFRRSGKPKPGQPETKTRVFNSAWMLLNIGHPGELYRRNMLQVRAEIEISNYLLSGLEAKLYSATGDKRRLRPKLTTRILLCTELWLSDVFENRTFSPYHRVVFDEVIPSEMVISDVVSVLGNLGFEVERPWADPDNNPSAQRWLLTARRDHLGERQTLLIAVDGRRRAINIRRIPADKRMITEDVDSGRIMLSVLGEFKGDHQDLTRDINALQQALRDHFRYH